MKAVIVTPTYNESGNIEEFVSKVRQAVPGAHILIVDDNSPDGTGRIADRIASRYPEEVRVLHRDRKLGLGRAYVAGFRQALASDYEAIVQMDADLSHDPAFLPAMLERIEHCDLVLGSRYTHGVSVINWDLKRLILSKAANRYARIVAGIRVTDATGGFKCWRRRTLAAIGLEDVFSNGYMFQIEMTTKAIKMGFRVEEVPIIFYERNLGKSKMDTRIVAEALWSVWKLRFRRYRKIR